MFIAQTRVCADEKPVGHRTYKLPPPPSVLGEEFRMRTIGEKKTVATCVLPSFVKQPGKKKKKKEKTKNRPTVFSLLCFAVP